LQFGHRGAPVSPAIRGSPSHSLLPPRPAATDVASAAPPLPPTAARKAAPALLSPQTADAGSLASQVGLPDSLPSLAESAIERRRRRPRTAALAGDCSSSKRRCLGRTCCTRTLRWGLYRLIDYRSITYKTEVARGHKKPWPKGLRLGSAWQPIGAAILWRRTGEGAARPESFLTIPAVCRSISVCWASVQALSARCLQPRAARGQRCWLQTLVESRGWGPTVLFVADTDKAPSTWPWPAILSWSILKHDTLVMTVDALRKSRPRLLHHLSRRDPAGIAQSGLDEPQATHFTGHYQA
uniref:DDE_5 domain-containing protein n=1 Tax=Macrostomum lignano TaxID=282301 RepID=A0A1I8FND7_9PLAT